MNNPITCVIVDDEPLAVGLLESYVAKTPQLQLVDSYTDSVQALKALREHPVNLVFMDIQMPDIDGMELSRMLPKETKIIFTTAFKEYAFESYEVSAVDFLLKPIRYNKFIVAVEKVQEWFSRDKENEEERTTIFIRVDGALRQVALDHVLYVSGMKDYVAIYMDDGSRLITHLTMTAMEEMLPTTLFLRVHRSYIVALKKIRSIDRNNCIYIGKEVIHVTEAYRLAFETYLQQNTV